MNTQFTLAHLVRRAATATAIAAAMMSLATPAAAQNAVGLANWTSTGTNDPALAIGGSLLASRSMGANSFTDNADQLFYSAWAHTGAWYAFQLSETADLVINLAPNAASAVVNKVMPGLTLWASTEKFNGGTEGSVTGTEAGLAGGTPHAFNAVGTLGSLGTQWMTQGSGGNLLQTLAYAVTGASHLNDPADPTGYGENILHGVNDVSLDSSFESGISGSVGPNSLTLNVSGAHAGWYTMFVGGTQSGKSSTLMDLSVAALQPVPEPATWGLMAAGLLGLASLSRRRQG